MFPTKSHFDSQAKTHRALIFLTFVLLFHIVLFKVTSYKKFHLSDSIQFEPAEFNPRRDYLVLMHIQGTDSTSLESRLLDNLLVNGDSNEGAYQAWLNACHFNTTQYMCTRNREDGASWFISSNTIRSELSFDSYPHLDEIKSLMRGDSSDRQVSYVTFIADPVKRFLYEWLRFKPEDARLDANNCLSEYAKQCEYIFRGNVTLDEFLMCRTNLALNRQTRMLASFDSSLCGYLRRSSGKSTEVSRRLDDQMLLESAKHTLSYMSFFGISEHPYYSMRLFERSYLTGFMFKEIEKEEEAGKSDETAVDLLYKSLSDRQLAKITQANHLDVELYRHATKLFVNKLKFYELF
jgi:hypothetical protein